MGLGGGDWFRGASLPGVRGRVACEGECILRAMFARVFGQGSGLGGVRELPRSGARVCMRCGSVFVQRGAQRGGASTQVRREKALEFYSGGLDGAGIG